MGLLRALTGSDHRFTVANTPFSNGTAERMVRETVKTMKAILLDRKRAPKDWVEYVKVV
jgi:hypothetical protein